MVERSYRIRCSAIETRAETLVDQLRELGFTYREMLAEAAARRAGEVQAKAAALLDAELSRVRWHQRIGFDVPGFVGRHLLPLVAAEYDAFRSESLEQFLSRLRAAGTAPELARAEPVPGGHSPTALATSDPATKLGGFQAPVTAAGVGGAGAAGLAAWFGAGAAGAAVVAIPVAVALGGAWAIRRYDSAPALREKLLAATGSLVRSLFYGDGHVDADGTRIEAATEWLRARSEAIEERLVARTRSARERNLAALEQRLAIVRSELEVGRIRWADVATPEDAERLLDGTPSDLPGALHA